MLCSSVVQMCFGVGYCCVVVYVTYYVLFFSHLPSYLLHLLPCRSFMESTTILSIAAMVCFVVYYEMVTSSYIEHVSTGGLKVQTDLLPVCLTD